MPPLLTVSDLTTTFPSDGRRVPVVDHVSFTIERGEVFALVGESGCGKSMSALSLLRLVPKPGRIDAGSIVLEGRDVLALSVNEMRAVRGFDIAMIFQEPMTSLNPVVPCGAQVVEAIRLHEKVTKAAARERTVALFKRVGIPDPEQRFDAYPHQLSGGLKQRVMIAMALSTHPKLLIADEPTTALDVTIQAQILELLRDLRRDLGMTIILITHDLGVVSELADRVAVMYAGRIVETGRTRDVIDAPLHPYTRGLVRSIPARAPRGVRLHEIAGVVPPPTEWPDGCRFANRCPAVLAYCAERVPPVETRERDHQVWCHAVTAGLLP
ncbi:MAG: ABC transporter ATP-binding protein [Deltaproteobacteria bacterium]|nr:ABC transporter ATP-binding protein [Deltaproteobacteria bacterium]